jgi:hypothetical protein
MRRTPLIAVFGLALIQAGCADSRTPTNPRAPSDVASADRTVDGQSGKVVSIFDACDPATFGQNGVSCTRSGGVTFTQFLGQITPNNTPGGWHFAPSELNVKVGEGFFALNRGGEMHTFTEVEHFGGGIIAPLNALSGNLVEAEECKHLAPSDFLSPGQSSDLDIADDEGTELYQCCIHPWMRTVVHKKG